jgi:hypothetical protein
MSFSGFRSSSAIDPGDWSNSGRMIRQAKDGPGDLLFSSVSLLLNFDGTNGSVTFTDRSLNQRPITAVGNSQLSTTTPKWGSACGLFDGTGDYLSSPAGSFSPGTGDFTIETWVRWTTLAAGGIFHAYSALPVAQVIGVALGFLSGTSELEVFCISGSVKRTFIPSTGVWYFMQLRRSGSQMSLWVDGAQLGASFTDSTDYTGYLIYPSLYYSASFTLNGRLDDFRVTHALRSSAVPTGPFPTASSVARDPLRSRTKLLLQPVGETNGLTVFTDRSPIGAPLTRNGNTVWSTTQTLFGLPTVYFDGSGDYLSAPTLGSFCFGTGDYCFETWIYKLASTRMVLIACGTSGLSIAINTSGNVEVCRAGQSIDFTFTASISNNVWTYIKVNRTGTTLEVFKDSTSLGTQTSSTAYGIAATNIGIDVDNTGSPTNAYLAGMRLTDVARPLSNLSSPFPVS